MVFFINDCRENFDLTVVNPSVNRSEWHFVADTPTNIIYGLGAIKGVGEGAVESIVDARRREGVRLKISMIFVAALILKRSINAL